MSGSPGAEVPQEFETSKKNKLKYFDAKLGKFRYQGKFITASEAERLAEEETKQEFGELTEKSHQTILKTQKPSPENSMSEKMNKKTLELDTILDGAAAWAGWTTALFNALFVHDIPGTDYTQWEIVTGEYSMPNLLPKDEKATSSVVASMPTNIKIWKQANSVALSTIRKNCSTLVKARIGTCETAYEAYKELEKAFQTQTTIEFYSLLNSLIINMYDDRKNDIVSHIAHYEQLWNNFVGIISRAKLDNDDGMGRGLLEFSKSDKAKAEFLLRSFGTYYANTIENIRAKEYGYNDVVLKLTQFIPLKKQNNEGTRETPVVLKTNTEKENKVCKYCRSIGRKGIGHTDDECWTKKSAEKKAKKLEILEEKEEGISIDNVRIGKIQTRDNVFEWDTGASHHTTNRLDLLHNVQDCNLTVRGHNGNSSQCTKTGTVRFNHKGKKIELRNVLYDPTYSNLISGQRIPEYSAKATRTGMTLKIGQKVFCEMERDENGNGFIRIDQLQTIELQESSQKARKILELHERYGHISFTTLKSLPECPKFTANPRCKACEKGKTTKPAAKNQPIKIRTSRILERIHVDLVGPITPQAKSYKYLLVATDDYSRYTVCIPLAKKSDAPEKLTQIIVALENVTDRRVSEIQADWGTEFRNKKLEKVCQEKGIRMKETVPGHSETNAIAERANRTIITMARTAIKGTEGKIAANKWDEAASWATYTKNRVPHKTLSGRCPVEIMLGKDGKEERKFLKIFGQKVICYEYDQTHGRKMDNRSFEAMIIGYSGTHGIYRILKNDGTTKIVKDPKEVYENQKESESEHEREPQTNTWTNEDSEISSPVTKQTLEGPRKPRRTPEEYEQLYGKRESQRIPIPSLKKREGNINETFNDSSFKRTIARLSALCGKPEIPDQVPEEANKAIEYFAYEAQIGAVGIDEDHPTEKQAKEGRYAEHWAKAREIERAQLRHYGVYRIIDKADIPEGTGIVDTKWVYVIKRNIDGSIQKFKARKVGRGFSQTMGINYDETYAQMMRPETWRLLIVIALYKGWDIRQWDVVAAYLRAKLNHDVYVKDVNEEGEIQYWKLEMALYGLKQAGHEWFNKLKGILESSDCQMRQSVKDEGCYYNETQDALLGTHVDDLLGVGTREALDSIEMGIEKHVELDKRGKPKKMLGIELKWEDNEDAVDITQTMLIETLAKQHKVIARTNLPQDKTYYEQNSQLEPAECKNYQRIVGGLLFIARMTRPDIAIYVNLLGRRAQSPNMLNLTAAKMVLSYLLGTKKVGLRLSKPENLEIEIVADASYAGEEGKSQTGCITFVGKQLIGWWTRKQDIIAQSITEAEYMAAGEGAKDAAWIKQILEELHKNQIRIIPTLMTDSEGGFKLSKTNKFARRTRHIEVRDHYLRQQVQSGKLLIKTITGKENLADPLTKLLPTTKIRDWRKAISMSG